MDYATEGGYVVGSYSGLITGVVGGSAANGHLWAMRFTTSGLDKRQVAVIQRLRVRAFTIAGFTAAQEVLLTLWKLTGYSAAHTGGVAIVPSEKMTSFPGPLATIRQSDTAQLTAGTHTFDAQPIRSGAYSELAAAPTVQKGAIDINMTTEDLIQFHIVLAHQEGLLVRNEIAMGAGGTMRLVVEVDWAEVQRYPVPTYTIGKSPI